MRTPRRSRISQGLSKCLSRRAAAAAGLAGASLALAACAAHASGPVAPDGGSSVYSGSATTDYHVVLDAFKDHMHIGICSGKNPDGVLSTLTAALVDVPASALAGNAECGKQITITNGSGSPVTATVVGECDSCGTGDLDVSPSLYLKLATDAEHAGSIPVSWQFSS
jgi:hypothetical protein